MFDLKFGPLRVIILKILFYSPTPYFWYIFRFQKKNFKILKFRANLKFYLGGGAP